MGTNYYATENECKECGRYDEVHLGKSSIGWVFTFQYNGGRLYKNIRQMKSWLVGKKIIDEYGETINHVEFWKMVKSKQKERHVHGIECASKYDFVIDGYSFSDHEFC